MRLALLHDALRPAVYLAIATIGGLANGDTTMSTSSELHRTVKPRQGRRWAEATAAGLTGILVATVAWVVLVPWDLSEVDAMGNLLADRLENRVTDIAIVVIWVASIGVFLAFLRGWGTVAVAFTAGGSAAWVGLFTWRAAVARSDGANLFFASLVMYVVPTAVLLVWLIQKVARYSAARDRSFGNE